MQIMSLMWSFNVALYHYYYNNCYGIITAMLNNGRACSPLFNYDVFYLIHGDTTMHKLSLQLGVVHVSYTHIPTVVYWIEYEYVHNDVHNTFTINLASFKMPF